MWAWKDKDGNFSIFSQFINKTIDQVLAARLFNNKNDS